MKKKTFLYTSLFLLCSCSMLGQSINQFEKTGFSFYNSNPDSAIFFYQKAIVQYNQEDDLKSVARCYQNMSFIYNEKYSDTFKSYYYANTALDIWQMVQDTLSSANITKYIALLYAQNKQFILAKKYIDDAIYMFKNVNYESGVYVTYFDYALILIMENKTQDAINLFKTIKLYWQKINENAVRIFLINNELISIYSSLKMEDLKNKIILENNTIINSNTIPSIIVDKFKELIGKI